LLAHGSLVDDVDPLNLVPLRGGQTDQAEEFYRRLAAAFPHGNEPLALDLSATPFVSTDQLLLLITVARWWHRRTGFPAVLVGMQPKVHRYLERMDLFTACGSWIQPDAPLAVEECWSRSPASPNLLEVVPIAAGRDGNARDVTVTTKRARGILSTWLRATPAEIDPIVTILAEVASNVVHSRDRGFAAIQHHRLPACHRVSIAVGDLGIGIESSLHQGGGRRGLGRDERPQGSAAILRALDLGVTSRSTVGGVGLHLVSTIVNAWHGTLVIRSGSACVRIVGGQAYTQDGLVDVPGTQVTITVRSALGNSVPI
jgi:anti-anti-sigma regulatory factor